MCCFSRPVEFVSSTRIFARAQPDGRQALVYSMSIGAREDLAMILPIPVVRSAGEHAVRFVDLQRYPALFDDLEAGFPQQGSFKSSVESGPRGGPRTLRVETVGSFVASYVPSVADFDRLDPRFRLPSGVWEKLGVYARYGFAVFQLKSGRANIHPMAFTFPTEMPGQLFFPTVHIHDGKLHRQADFDHVLFCQAQKRGQRALADWQESDLPAARFVDPKRAQNLVIADRHVFRRRVSGRLPNEDIVLAAA